MFQMIRSTYFLVILIDEMCCWVAQSYLTLCNPMDYIAHQAPLSKGFFKQEYWSGLPFPISGYPFDPGNESMSLATPALAGRLFTAATSWLLRHLGKPSNFLYFSITKVSFLSTLGLSFGYLISVKMRHCAISICVKSLKWMRLS